ncbi:MAG TPA: M1 family aminopeptidase [Thermoanaerobaculia bacterium]
MLAPLLLIGALAMPSPGPGRAALREEPPGTLLVTRYELDASARAGDPFLQIRARVSFRGASGRKTYPFRLRENFVVEEVRGTGGELLLFEQRGERLTIRPRQALASDEQTWSFRYLWPQTQALDRMGGLFAQTPWYPHVAPAAGSSEPPPAPARVTVDLPPPLAAVSSSALEVETRGEESRRFVWTDEQGLAIVPLLIGRYRWEERVLPDAGTSRVFFLRGEDARAERLLDFGSEALRFYTDSFGPVPRRSVTLAIVPLSRGQRGRTFGGLTVISQADAANPGADPERILAHEIAHQWWGVSVEFPHPEDGWLREGLPTYSALLFLEAHLGEGRLREELRNSRAIALSVEPSEPLAAGFGMSTWDAIYAQNYHKAAYVLHMLRGLEGKDAFLCLLADFHEAYRGGSASAPEFRWFAERWSGRPLAEFFQQWIERPGLPSLEVIWQARFVNGRFDASGRILQRGAPMRLPARLRVQLERGEFVDVVVEVTGKETVFEIACPSRPVALEIDPDRDLLLQGSVVREQASAARRRD